MIFQHLFICEISQDIFKFISHNLGKLVKMLNKIEINKKDNIIKS